MKKTPLEMGHPGISEDPDLSHFFSWWYDETNPRIKKGGKKSKKHHAPLGTASTHSWIPKAYIEIIHPMYSDTKLVSWTRSVIFPYPRIYLWLYMSYIGHLYMVFLYIHLGRYIRGASDLMS